MKESEFFWQAFHHAAFRAKKIKELYYGRKFTLVALFGSTALGLGFTIYHAKAEDRWDSGFYWLPTIVLVLIYGSCSTHLRALQMLSNESDEKLSKTCRDCLRSQRFFKERHDQ